MRGIVALSVIALVACAAGCGGSQEPTKLPEAEDDDIPVAEEPKAEPKNEEGSEPSEQGGKGEEGKGGKPAGAEPEFKDGMSVDEAINAVPQGTPRVNVDQEDLGRPLMNEGLYKPCKMGPQSHFKLRVAVWDGKAVGIDVVSTPKNPKLEECVKDQVKGVTWKNAVKSLNTVEYAH